MESSASSVSSKDSKRSLIWSHFMQIGSDNTNMIRLLRPMISIRFDSKFRIIAQLFDSIWNEKHHSHSTSRFTCNSYSYRTYINVNGHRWSACKLVFTYADTWTHSRVSVNVALPRVPTGQGKLEKVCKFEWSGENIFGKVGEKSGEIKKIGATRCQIFRLKCITFDFPRPRWWSLQRSPRTRICI